MNLVFGIGFILVFLIGNKIYKNLFNPVTLFLCNRLFALSILFSCDFINHDISLLTWVIYCLSFISFSMGVLVDFSLKIKQSILHGSEQLIRNVKQRQRHIIVVLSIMFFGGLIIYWGNGINRYGLEGLIINILVLYQEDILGDAPPFILYMKFISIFLSPYLLDYIFRYKEYNKKYFLIIVVTFLANLCYTRNIMLYILALDFFVFLQYKKRKKNAYKFKDVFIFFIGIICVLEYFSYTQGSLNKTFDVTGNFGEFSVNETFATVISYYVGALVSTSYYIAQEITTPFMGFTLRPLESIFNLVGAGLDVNSYAEQDFVFIPFKYNTATIDYYIYQEGGMLWIIIFFSFLGFLSSRIYRKCHMQQGPVYVLGNAYISILLLFSVRSYLMMQAFSFAYIFVLFSIVGLCYVKFK